MLKNTVKKVYFCNFCLKKLQKRNLFVCMVCDEYVKFGKSNYCSECYDKHLSFHNDRSIYEVKKCEVAELGNETSLF